MRVRVGYVDGSTVEGPPEEWAGWRSSGLDWVEAETGRGRTRVSGQSLYWLYAEAGGWVLGGGPVGYGALPPEVVVHGDRQAARPVRFAPDLEHPMVKLGWWWPGLPRPADG